MLKGINYYKRKYKIGVAPKKTGETFDLAEKTGHKTTYVTEEDIRKLSIKATVLDDGSLQFVTKGRWVSLNFIMSKAHWAKDMGIKEIVKEKIRKEVGKLAIRIPIYMIELRFNSKMDDHNTVMMPKYFTDAIKKEVAKLKSGRLLVDENKNQIVIFDGIIIDDDKRYSKGTILIPDDTLPHNTYILTYRKLSENQTERIHQTVLLGC